MAEISPKGIDSILTKLKICFSANTHNFRSLSESKLNWVPGEYFTYLIHLAPLLKKLNLTFNYKSPNYVY